MVEETNMASPLSELPLEIIHHVLFIISPAALGTMSCVSKFYQYVCEDPEVWRVMYEQRFGGPITSISFMNATGGYKHAVMKNYIALKALEDNQQKLIWATQQGHHSAVKLILQDTDAEVNKKDNNGNTCLHIASRNGALKVVKELISAGADIDEQNSAGETALQLASSNGYSQITSLLIAHKAAVNVRDKMGRSALHKACYFGKTTVVATLLQSPGINIELEERSYGQTALHIACGRNHVDSVMLLLHAHCNINAVDMDGWTPLHLACYKGNSGVVSALLTRELSEDCLRNALTYAESGRYPPNIVSLFHNTVK